MTLHAISSTRRLTFSTHFQCQRLSGESLQPPAAGSELAASLEAAQGDKKVEAKQEAEQGAQPAAAAAEPAAEDKRAAGDVMDAEDAEEADAMDVFAALAALADHAEQARWRSWSSLSSHGLMGDLAMKFGLHVTAAPCCRAPRCADCWSRRGPCCVTPPQVGCHILVICSVKMMQCTDVPHRKRWRRRRRHQSPRRQKACSRKGWMPPAGRQRSCCPSGA